MLERCDRLVLAAVAALAVAALSWTAPAQAQGPGTLAGESLDAHLNFFGNDQVPVGDLDVTGTCDPTGPSTFQFTATGPATGPYPGTFRESGTFTLGAPSPLRRVESFDVTFTIDSVLGQVTGSKFLSGTAEFTSSCTQSSDFRIVNMGGGPMRYEAHVPTATGTTSVRGETSVAMNDQTFAASPHIFNFHEVFFTSEEAPPGPATVTVTPPTATNNVGDQHCVTATVRDAAGNPLPGVSVVFEVSGANPQGPAARVTDQNGEARFCYTGLTPGDDVIRAFADSNGNGAQDAGEPLGAAGKTYVIPASTAGCSVDMGGGFVA